MGVVTSGGGSRVDADLFESTDLVHQKKMKTSALVHLTAQTFIQTAVTFLSSRCLICSGSLCLYKALRHKGICERTSPAGSTPKTLMCLTLISNSSQNWLRPDSLLKAFPYVIGRRILISALQNLWTECIR